MKKATAAETEVVDIFLRECSLVLKLSKTKKVKPYVLWMAKHFGTDIPLKFGENRISQFFGKQYLID